MATSFSSDIRSASRARHPSTLYLLLLVEFLERLAASAMLPLFALYLKEHQGRSASVGITLSSGFLAACYLASLPGGMVVDRIGPTRAVRRGICLLAIGFGGLAIDRPVMFWPALAALVIGQGLFKPGITTLISRLYSDGDPRRGAGFSLFYMAVNLGALAGPLIAEWARGHWGWPSIFICAAVAMGPAWLLLFLGARTFSLQAAWKPLPSRRRPESDERGRLRALVSVSAVSIVFWLTFQQTGTSLALFAEQNTVTTLGWGLVLRPGYFAALHAGLVLALAPLLLRLFDCLRESRADFTTLQKMLLGFLFIAAAFALLSAADLGRGADERLSHFWLGSSYLLLSLGELLLAPLGMSLIAEIAPQRWIGRSMGLWFTTVAVGNGLAALLGPLWSIWPHHRYFAAIAALSLFAATWLWHRLTTLEGLIPRAS